MNHDADAPGNETNAGPGDADPRPHADWPARAAMLLVTLLAIGLAYPLLLGRMPMSYDHTVHLARIVEQAEFLSQGRLSGWSFQWFFGAPIGELYPPLGDLLVILVHTAGLGLLSWSSAYALAFFAVFASQGWAMIYLGRRLGLGPLGAAITGVIAATLILLDPGSMREGGWLYTVTFGVWPQALSTTLLWIGFAALATSPGAAPRRRDLARAALAFGASILAHPVALPGLALGGPLAALWLARDARHRGAMALAAIAGTAAAAFWLVPMLQHRAWMASYGWLFASLDAMAQRLREGQWAVGMAPAAGWLALGAMVLVPAGLAVQALRSRRPRLASRVPAPPAGLRFVGFAASFSLALWLLASRDAFWSLRLDRLSDGFAHIQYQRFLIVAKPGLALLAAAVVGGLADAAARAANEPGIGLARPRAFVPGLLALIVGTTVIQQARRGAIDGDVGVLQTERLDPNGQVIEPEFRAAVQWLAPRVEPGRRVAVSDLRNTHWFMDATAHGVSALYKIGFTPGDNFVHKPEAGDAAVLDRLGVRWIVRRSSSDAELRDQVARFGPIRVIERQPPRDSPGATSLGSGALRARVLGPAGVDARVLDHGPTHLELELGLGAESGQTSALVVFDVAGYPRWALTVDGTAHPWFEVPAVGDVRDESLRATPASRERGELRGGKAHGDTGREPILIAAEVPPGSTVRLAYGARAATDVVVDLLSALVWLVLVPLAWGRGRVRAWILERTRGLSAPSGVARQIGDRRVVFALVALALLAAASLWSSGRTRDTDHAHSRVTALHRATIAPLKTDMLIRPAVVLRPKRGADAHASLPAVPCGVELTGWAAIDDDRGKRRRAVRTELLVEFAEVESAATSVPLARVAVPHRPGRQAFAFRAKCAPGQTHVDLRVRAHSSGKVLPVGFDITGLAR